MIEVLNSPVFVEGSPDFENYEAELDYLSSRKRIDFAQSILPNPETEQFKDEMDNAAHIIDEETGITYGVYQVNRDKSGKPLVLNMSWSVAAGIKPGRQEVKAYSERLERPITVIDMEAHGETEVPNRSWRKSITFDEIASTHLRIIDKLGVDEFDIEGMSMGGIVAAKIAEKAGSRVGALVTVSTISFEAMKKRDLALGFILREGSHQKQYVKEAHQAISDEAGVGFVGKISSVPSLLRLATMMTERVVPEAINRLNPNTKWYDFVGSKEEVTDWQAHLEKIRERNKLHPQSSSVYILGHETHSWGVHINAVAEAVTAVLKK